MVIACDRDVIGAGKCAVCGHTGEYVHNELPTRETYDCGACRAPLRYRAQAAAISAAFGRPGVALARLIERGLFDDLAIYEPGTIGPFRLLFRDLRGYVNSYYLPGAAGEEREGVRFEDLRQLTFADESFDLVISSDIFEHVRGPGDAFREVFRVLRPGGRHIFTVPLQWPLPGTTRSRVDYSGPDDVFLLPPQYHGSPLGGEGSLVYTDFGMDLPEGLRWLGFETVTHHLYRNALTFVSTKPGADTEPA